ncbi:MAG TPA: lysophospholipid acyltransferase family protein [Steroidobacteraceae bacterium]|nr:lysophospholipid acyltransferase family protein [Steroidobacteraceae bacterium]
MQLLGSLLFTTYLFASTFIFSMGVVLAAVFPYRARYLVARAWARSVLWVLKCTCRLDYSVEGREHIPADNHISMWKHSSSWETIAQMLVFPPQAWVLKHELMWIPVVGWAIRAMRPIAIDRGSGHVAVNQVIEQGKRRLANGMWILIFPEGTRMAAGQTRRYGVSGALLATQTGRLVLPVAHDAGTYWPRRGLMKQPGTIRVVIGPPIDPRGLEPRELNERIQNWIESTVARLQPR